MNTTNKQKVKRGELYFYDFGNSIGSIQSGNRPVLVVQCDDGNKASTTTIVAAITTEVKKIYLPSHIYLGSNFGLDRPSMVLLEQLKTVNQTELKDCIGIVNNDYMFRQINNGLKKALGLWYNKPQNTGNIRCLCVKCLDDYKSNPNYVVRRLEPLAYAKEKCDKCDNMGWDYVVYDKRTACDKGVRK